MTFLVMVTLLVAMAAEPVFGSDPDGAVVPGQFIVTVKAGISPALIAENNGAAPRHVFRAAINGFAGSLSPGQVKALRNHPDVVAVEQERVYHVDAQPTPTGIDRIEADKNPNATGVTVDLDVAIIDTGIDMDHSDLNIGGGINFSFGGAGSWNDGNGHGTHVSGTVAAIDNTSGVVGVAPGARVWAVKVCNILGLCFTGDIVAGIDWVADQKASGAVDFAAANMSISTSDDNSACTGSSGAVHEAICGLVGEGVVFVIAAGNEGRLKNAYPEALAVSALADFDGRAGGEGSSTCLIDEDDSLASFSNFGPSVDIAAPGTCILSTWNDGGTSTINGTSMASPHVTGAVALYIHANAGVDPATDTAGVIAIASAVLGAALPQGHSCGYTNEHAGEGSVEPLLFVNGAAFGGDGTCDLATPTADLVLTGPVPGTAGVDNTIMASGATPGATVQFTYGTVAGSTAVPGCPGVFVDFSDPNALGGVVADGSGEASITQLVPAGASGQTYRIQSAELDTCRVSNLVIHFFP